MFKLEPKEIPKSSIFECVKSKSKPRLNLSLGNRKIEDDIYCDEYKWGLLSEDWHRKNNK